MPSRKLTDLHPKLQPIAAKHIEECKKVGIDLLIYCTYRSNEEQATEYAKGRQVPGDITTWSLPGESKHNFTIDGKPASLAYDCVGLVNGKAAWSDDEVYAKIGEIGEKLGLEWAFRWKTKKKREKPHFQLSTQ